MSERRLSFLYEATKVLPMNQCGTFIRCQLMSQCHLINNVNLPAQNFKATVMCQGCGIQLSEIPPKTLLKSPTKPNKLIKKILSMTKTNKNLSPYQKKLYSSYLKKNHQDMVSICKMCNKKNVIEIKKPKFNTKLVNTEKKKLQRGVKKKKKDKFSGLKKAAVLSVSTHKSKIKPNNNPDGVNNIISNNNDNNKVDTNVDFISLDMTISPSKSYTPSKKNVSINKPAINNKNTSGNKSKKKKNKKTNIRVGKIQKNQVLKKTEKNVSKQEQGLKNLAGFLKQKPNKTNSLTDFLQNL